MGRIQNCFKDLRHQNKKGLIPYITAGDPSPDTTLNLMFAMVKSGANMIELGVPFSDPVADGPIIEKAHLRAVKNNVTLSTVLDIVEKFRKQDNVTPIILMTYLNPLEIAGYDHFTIRAKRAGVDGVLVVDCPPEESSELHSLLTKYSMDMIHLISPNTKDQRIKQICSISNGYVYYVSLKGITGAYGKLNVNEVTEKINHIKQFAKIPVCVGFGVKDKETARLLASTSDAVIMGTAIVNTISQSNSNNVCANITQQINNIRKEMDR